MPDSDIPIIDCLVLSGGGSKGAYGAGAIKALDEFRKLRKIDRPMCCVGTSAGALNAAVFATAGADALVKFWLEVTPRSILGAWIINRKFRGVKSRLRRFFDRSAPYHLYPSKALRQLLDQHIKLKAMANAHLIVAATNYSTGRLEAFYVSALIDQFKARDDALPRLRDRRLQHLGRIDTQDQLILALLASSAYPIFFPPVEISGSWYIDGGVGNHTPTREAAYFFRFLEELHLGEAGEVYCVKQDPPRTLEQDTEALTLSRLMMRAFEVYHYVHTEPIIRAWFRINGEMSHLMERLESFGGWLATQDLPLDARTEILRRVTEDVVRLGGATARRQIDMLEIEPSASLGDTFDFSHGRIQASITTGYIDMLKTLRERKRLDGAEYQELSNRRLWGSLGGEATEQQANSSGQGLGPEAPPPRT